MEFVSAVPFGEALAFYRICEAYPNAFIATLDNCVNLGSNEPPPQAIFFIRGEGGWLGDAVHWDVIEQLAVSINVHKMHDAALSA